MTWQPYRPSSEDTIAEIPSILQGNWQAISDIIDMSHYSFSTTSLSGRHRPGQAGLVYTGSQTQINALVNPVSGSLAIASGTGVEHFDSGVWKDLGYLQWPRFRAYISTNKQLTACTTSSTDSWDVIFDTESYDTLSGYNTGTGTFTVSAGGPYMIIASVTLCANAVCAVPISSSPTSSEWYMENSPVCLTATIVGSATRSTSTVFTAHGATLSTNYYEVIGTDSKDSDHCLCAHGGAGNATVSVGFASPFATTPELKVVQGMASADCASVNLCAFTERGADAVRFKLGLEFGSGSFYYSDLITASSTQTHFDYTWDTNPKTSVVWQAEDLSGGSSNSINGMGVCFCADNSSSAGHFWVYYLAMKYYYRFKNWFVVSDGSDSTYVTNAASPSIGDIDPMDIYKLESQSAVYPYAMPISGVKVQCKAAGVPATDALYGTLMFPSNALIQTLNTYTTDACAVGYVAVGAQVVAPPFTTTYTDRTASANNATSDDVYLRPNLYGAYGATQRMYYASTSKFNELDINISTPFVEGITPPGYETTFGWEYYNSAGGWSTLTVTDGTDWFKNSGTNAVKFTPPSDWASASSATITGSSGKNYWWIRSEMHCVVGSTVPCAAQLWVHPLTCSNFGNQLMLSVAGGTSALQSSLADYEAFWASNPCLDSSFLTASWTAAQVNGSGASAVSGWGYNFSTASSGASVSEAKFLIYGNLVPQEVVMELVSGGYPIRRIYNRIPLIGNQEDFTVQLMDTIYLSAGATLAIKVTKNNYNDMILAGSKYSFFSISRISGRCF